MSEAVLCQRPQGARRNRFEQSAARDQGYTGGVGDKLRFEGGPLSVAGDKQTAGDLAERAGS